METCLRSRSCAHEIEAVARTKLQLQEGCDRGGNPPASSTALREGGQINHCVVALKVSPGRPHDPPDNVPPL